jgi:hypothetical protein
MKEASMAETATRGPHQCRLAEAEPPRQGTVLEVIEHEYGVSYRVAWDDGHETTFRPTAGTVHRVEATEARR